MEPEGLPGGVPESIGEYRIVREIGRGGMATVFLAEDLRLHRKVAIKVLHAAVARDEAAVEAAVARDYPVIFGTLYVFGLIGLFVGLLSDLMYVFVDPRIDFERRAG